MHISSNSVISTSLSKIRLIDVSENRAAKAAEEEEAIEATTTPSNEFSFFFLTCNVEKRNL